MDIQGIISKLVEKVKAEPNILAEIKADPIKTIEKLIGEVIPEDKIKEIISGLEAKLGGGAIQDAEAKLKDLGGDAEAKLKDLGGDAEAKIKDAEEKIKDLGGDAEEKLKEHGGISGIFDSIKKLF